MSGVGLGKTGPRAKTGCFACRARHLRCDGTLPRCKRCHNANLVCERSRMIAYEPQTKQIPDALKVMYPSRESGHKEVLARSKIDEASFLLKCFREGIATWMDLFDYEQTYQRVLMRRTVTSDLLKAGVKALAARQQSLILKQQYWIEASENYYGIALRHLLDAIASHCDITETLPASVLLLSYELMASAGQDYNRHFFRARSTVQASSLEILKRDPLTMASYWIFFRHDVNIAFNNQCATSLDTSHWSIEIMIRDSEEDALGNAALVAQSRALQSIYRKTELHDISDRILQLHDDLQLLHNRAIADVLDHGPQHDMNTLLFYPLPAAASSQQILCSTRMLLYMHDMPMSRDLRSNIVSDLAQEIIDISLSQIPHSAQVQSVHVLFHAAKVVQNQESCQYVIDILDSLETEVGFCSTERITTLRKIMGNVKF